jgi:hypothetical protein
VPVLVEKDEEPKLIERYGLMQFPTIVWTDASGKVLAMTIQPESSDEALDDLEVARRWLRNPEPDEPR